MSVDLKIMVLGAGTNGAMAVLQILESFLFSERPHNYNLQLYCFHNPSKKIFEIGESISPPTYEQVKKILKVSDETLYEETDCLIRYGAVSHWSKANKDFVVSYFGHKAAHVNSNKFSKFILEKADELYQNFHLIEGDVTDITQDQNGVSVHCNGEQYTFDFLFDSSGWPSTSEFESGKYAFPEFEFVNNILAYQVHKHYEEDLTGIYVHDNGWMFGIPVKGRKTYGYAFNSNITTLEDATDHFELTLREYTDVESIDRDKIRNLPWKQFYRKNIIDGRIITLGNKLFFFDPLQGLPIIVNTLNVGMMCDIIMNKSKYTGKMIEKTLINLINQNHRWFMMHIVNLTAMNYAGKNKIDSVYWNKVRPIARDTLYKSESLFEWFMECKIMEHQKKPNMKNSNKPPQGPHYSPHNHYLMNLYLDGYGVDLEEIYS